VHTAKGLLSKDELSEILSSHKWGWPGGLSPHQRLLLQDVVAWRNERRRIWKRGFLRLAALIHEGQRLLDTGKISHFVLPWIDKFFISSQREADLEYLPGFVRWLECQGIQPCILFWEDTTHSRAPSLQLALERLRQQGMPFRGIGIFDGTGSRREDALGIICREYPMARLFALKPHSDFHNPRSLRQLLTDLDYGFFESYDSSWKDNLCFLYAGTQVFPFISVQSDMEPSPAWVGTMNHTRHLFGSLFRRELRRYLLGVEAQRPDPFSCAYAAWANLC
jgi:hypothetical protein